MHRICRICFRYQGKCMWDLWWTKWHWDRFVRVSRIFPASLSFHQCSAHITHVINTQQMAASLNKGLKRRRSRNRCCLCSSTIHAAPSVQNISGLYQTQYPLNLCTSYCRSTTTSRYSSCGTKHTVNLLFIRSITWGQGGKEFPTYNIKKKG